MRETDRKTLVWIAVLAAGIFACVWAFPRAFPYFPRDSQVNREEAREIALEKLRVLEFRFRISATHQHVILKLRHLLLIRVDPFGVVLG